MKKKLICIILALAMIMTMTTVFAFAETERAVEYYRWNERLNSLQTGLLKDCPIADDGLSHIGEDYEEWIVVKDKIQISDLKVHGEAHIILAEGGELVTTYIYGVNQTNLLHIHNTSEKGEGGILRIAGDDGIAFNNVDIDLCGGSVIIDENYSFGFLGKEITIHGGLFNIQKCVQGVNANRFVMTGGRADISATESGNAEIGIYGDVLMEGGDLNITARHYGIEGSATVLGGTLDILTGGVGVNHGLLTFTDNIERIHIAVNTQEMKDEITGGIIGTPHACGAIEGEHDNVYLYTRNDGSDFVNEGQFKNSERHSLADCNEVLLLPPDSELSNNSASIFSSGNLAIIVSLAAAVGIAAVAVIMIKKKRV